MMANTELSTLSKEIPPFFDHSRNEVSLSLLVLDSTWGVELGDVTDQYSQIIPVWLAHLLVRRAASAFP